MRWGWGFSKYGIVFQIYIAYKKKLNSFPQKITALLVLNRLLSALATGVVLL
jgi:hypothetical protein